MTRAEPTFITPVDAADIEASNDSHFGQDYSLRDSVAIAVDKYLTELDGQMATDVYQMVLAEVEGPLLEKIMAYTRNNQTRAANMLGLNRGTLRKKLKQHKLIGGDS